MNHKPSPLNNQNGAMMIVTVLVLALLTIIGLTAATTSTTELQIAANNRNHHKAVYAAESGISHMVAILQSRMIEGNKANMASGTAPNWNFAIAADAPESVGFERNLDTHFRYFAQVRDNCDEVPGDCTDAANDPNADVDRLMVIHSDGLGPQGTKASVEIVVQATLNGSGISGYSAQAGGGSGKNSNANDAEAITDLSSTDLGHL